MYFITAIGKDDMRCVGYFKHKSDAISVVRRNVADIWEAGCYPYAVIEEVDEGLYQYDPNPMWYKFNEKTQEYEESKTPDFIGKHMLGFGIG